MNVVKALPPLVIEESEIRRFAAALEDVVAQAERLPSALAALRDADGAAGRHVQALTALRLVPGLFRLSHPLPRQRFGGERPAVACALGEDLRAGVTGEGEGKDALRDRDA